MFVIHEPMYQFQFGKELSPKFEKGEAFCVVGENVAIFGKTEILKSILGPKKSALSVHLATGLRSNSLKDTFDVLLDINALATNERSGLKQMAEAVPGLSDLLGDIHTVSLRGNEKDRFHGMATVWCKDAIHAAKVKKVADEGVVLAKSLFKDSDDHSAERRKLNKDLREVLDAVRLSVVDSQVRAELSVDPMTAVNGLVALSFDEKKKSSKPK